MEAWLIQLIIVLIICGGIAAVVNLVPFLPDWLKTAIYILLAVVVLVYLIRGLFGMSGMGRLASVFAFLA